MKKRITLIVAAAVLVLGTALGTVAYLVSAPAPAKNTFAPAKVTCQVKESFAGGVKSNVTVQNTGTTAAFIRAAVVANWVAEDGTILATAPVEGTDYTVDWGDLGWIHGGDGFYYYAKAVPASGVTDNLMDSCVQSVEAPTGYQLSIQILASAVQSKPERAAEEAWGVQVTGEYLSLN